MAVREILVEGDPVLRKTSREVKDVTPRIVSLLDDMRETLKMADGLGLAAPQVGVLRRLIVVSDGKKTLELINPEIMESDGRSFESEGCLSVPGVSGKIYRPKTIRYRAVNRHGKTFMDYADDLMARCICHEIDHLDGILIRDKIVEYDEAPEAK